MAPQEYENCIKAVRARVSKPRDAISQVLTEARRRQFMLRPIPKDIFEGLLFVTGPRETTAGNSVAPIPWERHTRQLRTIFKFTRKSMAFIAPRKTISLHGYTEHIAKQRQSEVVHYGITREQNLVRFSRREARKQPSVSTFSDFARCRKGNSCIMTLSPAKVTWRPIIYLRRARS